MDKNIEITILLRNLLAKSIWPIDEYYKCTKHTMLFTSMLHHLIFYYIITLRPQSGIAQSSIK